MRMNRRNVLVGLGTIVAGGGAALGTGAFSSVKAQRSVSVETSGDASALLQLKIVSSELHDGSDGTNEDIEFDQNSLNESALSQFNPGLRVGNNGGNSVHVSLNATNGNAYFATSVADTDPNGMYFVNDSAIEDIDGDGDYVLTLSDGETDVDLEVAFNLDDGSSIPESITFIATDSSGSS